MIRGIERASLMRIVTNILLAALLLILTAEAQLDRVADQLLEATCFAFIGAANEKLPHIIMSERDFLLTFSFSPRGAFGSERYRFMQKTFSVALLAY